MLLVSERSQQERGDIVGDLQITPPGRAHSHDGAVRLTVSVFLFPDGEVVGGEDRQVGKLSLSEIAATLNQIAH